MLRNISVSTEQHFIFTSEEIYIYRYYVASREDEFLIAYITASIHR